MSAATQDLFSVLAEPRRRRILDLLLEEDLPAGAIVDSFDDIAQPTVSKHLAALRRAGLVTVRSEAQKRWYHLEPAPLSELDAWLVPYRKLWTQRLDALGEYLDHMPDE